MCIKEVNNYPHALEFISKCYKTQKMCDKAVSTYTPTIRFVHEWLMTQEVCHKAVKRCFFLVVLDPFE